MAFVWNLVFAVLGAAASAGFMAWWFGFGWGKALLFGMLFLVITAAMDWNRDRKTSRLRRWYLLRGSQPPPENSIAFRALAAGPVEMWSVELGALGFVTLGIFLLIAKPEKWLIWLAVIGFFGLCAAVSAYMLLVHREAAKARDALSVATTQRKDGEPA